MGESGGPSLDSSLSSVETLNPTLRGWCNDTTSSFGTSLASSSLGTFTTGLGPLGTGLGRAGHAHLGRGISSCPQGHMHPALRFPQLRSAQPLPSPVSSAAMPPSTVPGTISALSRTIPKLAAPLPHSHEDVLHSPLILDNSFLAPDNDRRPLSTQARHVWLHFLLVQSDNDHTPRPPEWPPDEGILEIPSLTPPTFTFIATAPRVSLWSVNASQLEAVGNKVRGRSWVE